jgi:uncharacterized OsmC-like protein
MAARRGRAQSVCRAHLGACAVPRIPGITAAAGRQRRLDRLPITETIMNADELRALQAPLKQRYRDDPAAARIPARAEGTLEISGVSCAVRVWKGEARAGLLPAGGGTGELACSADMLLEALVGCAGVTLAAVATAMAVPITGGRVVAEGIWDARGTLGVDRAAPVGLTEVALRFEIESDAPADRIARVVELAERYCVIAQTLKTPPKLAVSHVVV